MAAILADGRDAQRVALVALGERDDRPRHGRREQQRAARRRAWRRGFPRAPRESPCRASRRPRRAPTTCELRQVERAALEMVAQPPRRADDDRARPATARGAPSIASMPPTQVDDPRAGLGVEPVELAADLQRQLAGRRDDQRQRARARRRPCRWRRAIAPPSPGRRRRSCPTRSAPRRSGRGPRRRARAPRPGPGSARVIAALGERLGESRGKRLKRHDGPNRKKRAPLAPKGIEHGNAGYKDRSAPDNGCAEKMERAKGFEPSTPTLARLCSTPELRPLDWRTGDVPVGWSGQLACGPAGPQAPCSRRVCARRLPLARAIAICAGQAVQEEQAWRLWA